MRSSRHSSPAAASTSNPTAAERKAVLTVVHQVRPRGIGGVPVIKLQGDWLELAGFPTGTYAVLRAAGGRIVIEAQGHLSESGAVAKRDLLRASLRAS